MATVTDDLVKQLGNPGRVQVFLFLILAFNYFPIFSNMIIMGIYGAKVSFRGNDTDFEDLSNSTSEFLHDTLLCCNGTGNQTKPCSTGWIYDTTEVSMVTEWNLVCDREYLVAMLSSIYFAGAMLGGLVVGFLSDTFGRKPIILATVYTQLVIGVAIFFVQEVIVYAVLRFVQGFMLQGLQTASFVMIMELFRTTHRSYVGPVMEIFWGVSYVCLAGIWYFIQDWRYIQLAISLPSALTIIYICVLPESLRWLLSKNKFTEAETLVRTIAKYNKIPTPKCNLALKKSASMLHSTNKTTRYNALDLFKSARMRHRSLILFFQWFSTSFIYFGLSLDVTHLPGDKFLNFFISGVVELPAYVFSMFLIRRFGRRVPLSVYFIICGLVCIGSSVLNTEDRTQQSVSLALVMFGKACSGGVLSIVFLYAAELYPTLIRNIGCGVCALFMRAGGLVAPQVLRLKYISFRQLPIVIFGVFGLAAGALTLLLPETLNQQLPEKIDDIEIYPPSTEKSRKISAATIG